MALEIGILIFGYNRPEMLENQIRFAIGTKLNVYVNLDGPKRNSFEANKQCAVVIEKYRLNLKDFSVSSVNKGCNLAVTEAITWAFTREEALIILEDDIEVDEHFLDFATLMLNSYQSEKKIGGISAMNLVPAESITNSSLAYRMTCFTSSWGWATWRDRWDEHLELRSNFPIWKWNFPISFWTPVKKTIWKSFFSDTVSGRFDTWDFRWQYTNWISGKLTIIPNKNLGLNLGFGPGATHTNSIDMPAWLPTKIEKMTTSPQISNHLMQDLKADKWMAKNHFGATINNFLRIRLGSQFPRLKTLNLWVQRHSNR